MFNDLITRSSFFRDLSDLHRGLEAFAPTRGGTAWSPALEGHVKDNTLFVRCDLPGVDPSQVEVSLEGGLLKISGERTAKHEGTDYSEVRYGRFERTLSIPEGVDPEKIQARYTNGVLEVTVPLAAVQVARRVPIQVEGKAGDAKKAA
jgi:HSP20 family protein